MSKKQIILPLSDKERENLEDHETVIRQGLSAFLEVGNALLDIRTRKLYRDDYDTFEDYCRTRWHIGKSRAYQLIEAAEVAGEMSTTGGQIPLENERQARALSAVVPHLRAGVLKRIHDAGETVTEQSVTRAVNALLEEQRREQHEDEPGEEDEEDEDEEETPEERTLGRAAQKPTKAKEEKEEEQYIRCVRKMERWRHARRFTMADWLKLYRQTAAT